jgi:hypothetical protein
MLISFGELGVLYATNSWIFLFNPFHLFFLRNKMTMMKKKEEEEEEDWEREKGSG